MRATDWRVIVWLEGERLFAVACVPPSHLGDRCGAPTTRGSGGTQPPPISGRGGPLLGIARWGEPGRLADDEVEDARGGIPGQPHGQRRDHQNDRSDGPHPVWPGRFTVFTGETVSYTRHCGIVSNGVKPWSMLCASPHDRGGDQEARSEVSRSASAGDDRARHTTSRPELPSASRPERTAPTGRRQREPHW